MDQLSSGTRVLTTDHNGRKIVPGKIIKKHPKGTSYYEVELDSGNTVLLKQSDHTSHGNFELVVHESKQLNLLRKIIREELLKLKKQ